jgi:hypothetical protein
MWMQAIAIILPRVQRHFARESRESMAIPRMSSLNLPSPVPRPVPDNLIGLLSSTMFAGMMFGAVGWGTCTLTCFFRAQT